MLPRFAILFAAAGSFAFAGAIDFSRDIQPILSENCYHCHGPDAKGRKAELRLDQKEGALRVQDGVAVVKPGRVMFEIEGVTRELAETAMGLAAAKLGVKTKFVAREEAVTE